MVKPPPHIVKNRGVYLQYNGAGKWFNLLTNETYKTDADLTDYLSTYKPMIYWTSWENHLNKKQLKTQKP